MSTAVQRSPSNSLFNLWPPVNVGVWSGECNASVHIVVAEMRVSLYHVKCYILYKIGQQCQCVGREHKIKNNPNDKQCTHVQFVDFPLYLPTKYVYVCCLALMLPFKT